MQLITLADLSFLVNPKQLTIPSDLRQEELQLIMKQTCLKLPTERLLLANPQLDKWIWEVGLLFPEIFEWQPPKLLVDTQFNAKFNREICVQINTNAAFLENQFVCLIEWAIREPALNWCDRVKLWAVAESLLLPPENIKLTVLALHPTQPGTRCEFTWDSHQHAQARDWLGSTLADPVRESARTQEASALAIAKGGPQAIAPLAHWDIEQIPEVEI